MNPSLPDVRLFASSDPDPGEDLAPALADLLRRLHVELGGRPGLRECVFRAALAASRAVLAGHACADAAQLEEADGEDWRAALLDSPVVACAQSADPFRPLVLDAAGRLYLYRYWDYERRLARRLVALDRAVEADEPPGAGALLDGVDDSQREAIRRAWSRGLALIAGGPGTGKTTTVVRVLAGLLAREPHLRIALAAPTGKAAARLEQAVRERLDALALPPALRAGVPVEARTIHRLLGVRPGRAECRHGPGRPLPFDVVVADEASMLDLALAARLVEALPPRARLLLLGDPGQLASVEAGAVFAQACAAAAGGGPLEGALGLLRESHRFGGTSGIGRLADAVRAGDAGASIALLDEASLADAAWVREAPESSVLTRELLHGYTAYVTALQHRAGPAEVLAAFDRCRILVATREGPFGMERINALIGAAVAGRRAEAGVLPPWYPGRAVLVTRNDYGLRLFNGDVGVVLPGRDGLMVHFPDPSGSTREVLPGRLGECETAFAMTVHRAQGSEFDRVEVLLPSIDSDLLTREWLYTGITRARRGVRLWSEESVLRSAIARRTPRRSGLEGALAAARQGMA
jgi:exodeoxyribonuclease V alpha subunit